MIYPSIFQYVPSSYMDPSGSGAAAADGVLDDAACGAFCVLCIASFADDVVSAGDAAGAAGVDVVPVDDAAGAVGVDVVPVDAAGAVGVDVVPVGDAAGAVDATNAVGAAGTVRPVEAAGDMVSG